MHSEFRRTRSPYGFPFLDTKATENLFLKIEKMLSVLISATSRFQSRYWRGDFQHGAEIFYERVLIRRRFRCAECRSGFGFSGHVPGGWHYRPAASLRRPWIQGGRCIWTRQRWQSTLSDRAIVQHRCRDCSLPGRCAVAGQSWRTHRRKWTGCRFRAAGSGACRELGSCASRPSKSSFPGGLRARAGGCAARSRSPCARPGRTPGTSISRTACRTIPPPPYCARSRASCSAGPGGSGKPAGR